MSQLLAVASIRTDGGTQPRAAIDFNVVDDYTDAMEGGAKFPPITVFYDGTDYWLADGFHRLRATMQAGRGEIACDVHQGTQQDAQWFSFAANKANGLRRTNDDKQRAVKAALLHPRGVGKSDSVMAKHVGVDTQTVSNWRSRLEATSEIRKSTTRTGSDGRTINTENIGRKPVEPTTPSPSVEPERKPQYPPVPEGCVIAPPPVRREPEEIRRPAPPPPAVAGYPERDALVLLKAMADLSKHDLSAAEFLAQVPTENIAEVMGYAAKAYEFAGFVYDGAAKRLKETA